MSKNPAMRGFLLLNFILNYFFLLVFFFGVQASFAIVTMVTMDQTTWSVKENQAFFGERPTAIKIPATRLRT